MRKANSRLDRTKQAQKKINLNPKLKKYLKHLPTLILGLIFSASTYLILTRIEPSQIKNFLLPNSYLLFLISLFTASFFLISYLFLSIRTGLILSSPLIIMAFLKLQNVIFEKWLIISLVGSFVGLEIIIRIIKSTKSSV